MAWRARTAGVLVAAAAGLAALWRPAVEESVPDAERVETRAAVGQTVRGQVWGNVTSPFSNGPGVTEDFMGHSSGKSDKSTEEIDFEEQEVKDRHTIARYYIDKALNSSSRNIEKMRDLRFALGLIGGIGKADQLGLNKEVLAEKVRMYGFSAYQEIRGRVVDENVSPMDRYNHLLDLSDALVCIGASTDRDFDQAYVEQMTGLSHGAVLSQMNEIFPQVQPLAIKALEDFDSIKNKGDVGVDTLKELMLSYDIAVTGFVYGTASSMPYTEVATSDPGRLHVLHSEIIEALAAKIDPKRTIKKVGPEKDEIPLHNKIS